MKIDISPALAAIAVCQQDMGIPTFPVGALVVVEGANSGHMYVVRAICPHRGRQIQSVQDPSQVGWLLADDLQSADSIG